jgi:hypothetical protein
MNKRLLFRLLALCAAMLVAGLMMVVVRLP